MPRTLLDRTLFALLILSTLCLAGGGPETTLIVVNGRSPSSRRIANEYRSLRGIPASHLVVLDTVPHDGVIPLATYRTAIWKPIAAYIKEAGLDGQIDLIAYSVDFPYAVDFKKELDSPKPGHQVGGHASLTGVTYLIRQVEAESEFWGILRGQKPRETNRYFRLGFSEGRKLTGAERNLAVKAQRDQKAGKLGEARRTYEEFLARAPDFGRVWVAYASCLVALRERDAAFDALNKAAARGFNQVGLVQGQAGLAALRADKRWAPTLERIRTAVQGLRPTRGFRSTHAWNASGEPVPEPASVHRYVLSVQLGYTGFKGNSVPEVLEYLRASVKADATNPDGTVYICKNGNVRSRTRERFFGPLESALHARGRKVEVLENTKVPQQKNDVIGAVVGTASFNWGKSGSTMMPGALCEHLTSFGAHFGTPGQTKFTEFLRYGAAGSSGTVIEPLAIHLKFPNPMIHAFYADGCSLAEAFYQSIHGPYQLMVAGDGLCQPFADPPAFDLDVPKQPWKEPVELAPKGDSEFEYWLDGRRVASGESYTLDPAKPWRDLRVVAVSKSRIETRAARRFERGVERIQKEVEYGRPIELGLKLSGPVHVFYGSSKIASGAKVPSELVGPGPVRLIVRDDNGERAVDVVVGLADAESGASDGEPAIGLVGTINDSEPVLVTSLAPNRMGMRLRDQLVGHKGVKRLQLAGALYVAKAASYQLNVKGSGQVVIKIGGAPVVTAKLDRQVFGTCSLGAGWHELEIDYTPRGAPDLELLVAGGQAAQPPRLGRLPAATASPTVPPTWKARAKGGYEVEWKKTPKQKVAAFGLVPAKGVAADRGWKLEWRKSKRGKWMAAKDLRVLLAPASARPAKGKKAIPLGVELIFTPVKARYFRLIPKAPTQLAKILVTRTAQR